MEVYVFILEIIDLENEKRKYLRDLCFLLVSILRIRELWGI